MVPGFRGDLALGAGMGFEGEIRGLGGGWGVGYGFFDCWCVCVWVFWVLGFFMYTKGSIVVVCAHAHSVRRRAGTAIGREHGLVMDS